MYQESNETKFVKLGLTNLVVEDHAVPFKVTLLGHCALMPTNFPPFMTGSEAIFYNAVHSVNCCLLNIVSSLKMIAFDLEFYLQKQKEVTG